MDDDSRKMRYATRHYDHCLHKNRPPNQRKSERGLGKDPLGQDVFPSQ